jgi:hypothetical protein
VLASIAAAGSICCKRLGHRSNDTSHDYQDTNPTFDETQRALRSMEVVLRLAITA